MSEPYKPLPMYKKKGLSDDDALIEGIRVQNENYQKLLAFVRKVDGMMPDEYEEAIVWLCDLEEEAEALLKEIGET